MRINGTAASYLAPTPQPEHFSAAQKAQNASRAMGGLAAPGIIVDISPKTWNAYNLNKETQKANAIAKASGGGLKSVTPGECQTCKNRSYQDVSDDPSVSFQSAAHISPGQAASRVLSHEYEHVSNEKARAENEGREIISQSVTLQTAFCPECGRIYVSGGTTRTISADVPDS